MKLLVALILLISVFSAQAECCPKSSKEFIVKLNHSIDLNESFKKSVKQGSDDEYYRLRKESEDFDENEIMPCLEKSEVLLNYSLLPHYLNFVISHQNSADERIAVSLARVFSSNTRNFESALHELSSKKRKIVIDSLEDGWPIFADRLPAKKKISAELKLKSLKSNLNKAP